MMAIPDSPSSSAGPSSISWRGGVSTIFVLFVIAFVVGLSVGAPFTFTSGPKNTGGGDYNPAAHLSWWNVDTISLVTIPATVPSAVSTTVGTPTVLPVANTSYRLGAATAGHTAILWSFTEAKVATLNTVLQLVFTITVGSTPTTTHTVAYVKTNGTALSFALTISIYIDEGTGAIVLDWQEEATTLCRVATCLT